MSRQRRLQWGEAEPAPLEHPFRDSLLVYGGLAVVIVVIAWVSGGPVGKAALIAAGFFVLASVWSLVRWRRRLRRQGER
ncbi:MAG TPA: hypothetical protein VNC40_07045 [Gaiellaceae bacterium]|nr:hypothetical protein [Gaiellaceae bacterium]